MMGQIYLPGGVWAEPNKRRNLYFSIACYRHPPMNQTSRNEGEMTMKETARIRMNYIPAGDYFILDIRIGEPVRPLRRWGRMKRDFLREHREILYNDLVLTGKLWPLLNEIDDTADRRLHLMMEQLMAAEGATEELKKQDQMLWVQKMTEIRHRAEEVILSELIYEDTR